MSKSIKDPTVIANVCQIGIHRVMEPNVYEPIDIVPDELVLQIEHVLREEHPIGRMDEPVGHPSTRVHNILLTCHRSSPNPPQTDLLTRIDLSPVSLER